jgi:DNA-binding NtrC family response regulator
VTADDLALAIQPTQFHTDVQPVDIRPASPAPSLVTLDSAEKMLIENSLKQSGNNVSEAARLLGITRMAMRYRMEKHGLKT